MRRLATIAAAVLAVLAISVALVAVFAWPSGGRDDAGELARLVDRLATGPDAIAPGATAYVSGPEGTWSHAAGVADLRSERPMQPAERFRIASITKPITATVVLQLAAEGKLGLDDTLERHAPGLLPFGSRITVRQLVTHTSGIWDSNDVDDAALARVRDPELRAELEALAARFEADPSVEFPSRRWIELAGWQPLYFEPGTAYHYSNVGYDVLGEIVERVTGNPLGTELERRIFAPLGLEATAYEPDAQIAGPHARLYAADGDGWADRTTVTSGVGAGGAIVSTAEETARIYSSLLRGELLPPRWLAAMKAPSPIEGAAGLGLGIDSPLGCGGTAYGHGGALAGVRTWVFVSGDGSRVATLFLNGRGPDTDRRGIPTHDDLYCATEE